MGIVAVISLRVLSEKDSDLHECFDGGEIYSTSFHLHANVWLAFWLFLMASSYFLLRKTVNYFLGCRIKPALVEVSSANPNASTENDAESDNISFSKNNCDAYPEISDFERDSYLHSLLNLEEEDSEGLLDENPSDSKPDGFLSENLSNVEEFSADDDEPLFWPFEGEINWNSEEPSFCNSPRRKVVFDSRIQVCEQKNHETFVDEDLDSNKDVVLGREFCFALDDEEVPIEKLVGLKEFDGHEGLDLEYDGELFIKNMNVELPITKPSEEEA